MKKDADTWIFKISVEGQFLLLEISFQRFLIITFANRKEDKEENKKFRREDKEVIMQIIEKIKEKVDRMEKKMEKIRRIDKKEQR